MNIEEIAKRANVSKAAVSLALNNRPGVGPDTRRRIMDIVKESGYKHRSMVDPKPALAGDLEDKLIRVVGCIKPDTVSHQYQSSSFFTEVLRIIEKNARKLGYATVFSSLDEGTNIEELQKLEATHPSSGIILLGTNLLPTEVVQVVEKYPRCVILDTIFEHLDADFVVMDNFMGGYSAARYLVEELGYRNIGYAEAGERIANFRYRKLGFYAACEHFKCTISPQNIFSLASDIGESRQKFKQLVEGRKELPPAIFCECDYMAIGVIQALNEAGLRVPDDVSVIGFDDVPEAAIVSPPLTTISVPRHKMGELAVQHLIQMKNQATPHYVKTLINTSIIHRLSCKPNNGSAVENRS